MQARPTEPKSGLHVSVRRIHRRDVNRTWDFLKKVFRDVNRETVEYQRPRSKRRFLETYAQEGVEQLLFEVGKDIVGYAECAFDASGEDNWVNPRYFDKRGMRPLYVEELAVHPDYQGQGVGSFMLDQLQHLARVRGCTHLVLEVAENNEAALAWYRKRNFFKLDAAIFMAQKLPAEPELLPPRKLPSRRSRKLDEPPTEPAALVRKGASKSASVKGKEGAKPSTGKPGAKPRPASTRSKSPAKEPEAGEPITLAAVALAAPVTETAEGPPEPAPARRLVIAASTKARTGRARLRRGARRRRALRVRRR